jgi:hypothetical protein
MFSIKSVTCYFVAGILMGTAPASAQIQQPSPQAQFLAGPLAQSLGRPQAQFLARSLHQEWHQQHAPDVVEPGLAVATTQIQQASPQQASPQAQVRSQQGSQQAAPAITIITPGATAAATAGVVTTGVITGVATTTGVPANPAVSLSITAARRR